MKIINKGKRKYTREEAKTIRDFLYNLAKLQIESNSKTKDLVDDKN